MGMLVSNVIVKDLIETLINKLLMLAVSNGKLKNSRLMKDKKAAYEPMQFKTFEQVMIYKNTKGKKM